MKHFLKLAQVDPMPVMQAIAARPQLWGAHRWRTEYEGTPHRDVSDIWLRYSDPEKTADAKQTRAVQNDDRPVFYPAWDALPQVRPIVFGLMRQVEAIELGRVLITRLPPGGRIAAHSDATGAYTDQPGRRYHVVLQGLPGSLFRCGDETVNMRTGEVWLFDHMAEHEVANNSTDDRIHLLVDLLLC